MPRAIIHLDVVEPHFPLYRRASRAVMERLHAVSPIVQQLSIDEAFLEVSDRAAEVTTIARALQTRIRDELKLPSSASQLYDSSRSGVG
ncbi:MAG TPA: hypothetical protein VLA19_17210 [Herpetosiphonaceae bacterium]|nr:hypothetical protein [Herpetosiphonaceae bacterium]